MEVIASVQNPELNQEERQKVKLFLLDDFCIN